MEDFISTLPAELLFKVCQLMTLEDVLNLQIAYPYLEEVIDNVFFSGLQKMRVTWDDKGAMIVLSPRRNHSYLKGTYSMPGESHLRDRLISRACGAVHSVTLSLNDHHRDFSILENLKRADVHPSKLSINLETPKNQESRCRSTVHRAHRKLTEFVREKCGSLELLKLSTSPTDSVVVDLRPADTEGGPEARVAYSHCADSATHQSLIYPLFNALHGGRRRGPANVSLTVDWHNRLDLAMQAAFMVGLPMRHRSGVKKLRIGFAAKMAAVPSEEIHECLVAFASSLMDTHNLGELLCDFSNSQLDPHQLEATIREISSHLGGSHRIRILTPRPPECEGAQLRKDWLALPKVY